MRVFAWESRITAALQHLPGQRLLGGLDRLFFWPAPPLIGCTLSALLGDVRYAAIFAGNEILGMALKGLAKRGRWQDSGVYAAVHEYGLPSVDVMHATSTALLTALMFGGAAWVAVIVLPALVGLARITNEQHYPLDVLVGWALALGWTLRVA